jgi:hypothetical protein
MYRHSAVVVGLLIALPAAGAEPKFDADSSAKAVAPFIDEQTVAVLHVNLDVIDFDALFKKADMLGKFDAKDKATAKAAAAMTLDILRQVGAHDYYVVVSLADVQQGPPFSVVPMAKDGDPKAVADQVKKVYGGLAASDEMHGAVVVGAEETLKRLANLKPTPRPEIAKAFTAAGDGTAQLALFATTDTRKFIEKQMPKLPAELGGGSIQVLTQGLQWAAVRLDTKTDVEIHVTAQAADNVGAKALVGLLDKASKFIREDKDFQVLLKDIPAEKLTPKVDDSRLVLDLKEETLVAFAKPAVVKIREAAFRMQSSNNLKQLLLAMHNYHDANGTLPAQANFSKDGKPLLSWRVHVLPYIEEGPLYQQFHLDEPWDSEHNKALIKKMPKLFMSSQDPKVAEEGKTTYLGIVGKSAMFTGDQKGVRLTDVTDGTANTIMLVDADDKQAVIWTKPDDLKPDPKDPKKGLSTRFAGRFLVAMADGSVRMVSATIDKATLNAVFTRNGGEVIGEIPEK